MIGNTKEHVDEVKGHTEIYEDATYLNQCYYYKLYMYICNKGNSLTYKLQTIGRKLSCIRR
jgi:hypothetical protein